MRGRFCNSRGGRLGLAKNYQNEVGIKEKISITASVDWAREHHGHIERLVLEVDKLCFKLIISCT